MSTSSDRPTSSLRRSARNMPPAMDSSKLSTSSLPQLDQLDESAAIQKNAQAVAKNSSFQSYFNAKNQSQEKSFTKEEFQALIEKQAGKKEKKGSVLDDLVRELLGPAKVEEISRREQNPGLMNEVTEWVEFVERGVSSHLLKGEKKNSPPTTCKWIHTTRVQDENGQWSYVDRRATIDEIFSCYAKGWPWYRS